MSRQPSFSEKKEKSQKPFDGCSLFEGCFEDSCAKVVALGIGGFGLKYEADMKIPTVLSKIGAAQRNLEAQGILGTPEAPVNDNGEMVEVSQASPLWIVPDVEVAEEFGSRSQQLLIPATGQAKFKIYQ